MSGLLVKSTAFMKDNLAAFNEAGINVPVILGGAALTPRFVNKDCRNVYDGQVIYGRDAFADLRFMDALVTAKNDEQWDNAKGFLGPIPEGLGLRRSTQTSDLTLSRPQLPLPRRHPWLPSQRTAPTACLKSRPSSPPSGAVRSCSRTPSISRTSSASSIAMPYSPARGNFARPKGSPASITMRCSL